MFVPGRNVDFLSTKNKFSITFALNWTSFNNSVTSLFEHNFYNIFVVGDSREQQETYPPGRP